MISTLTQRDEEIWYQLQQPKRICSSTPNEERESVYTYLLYIYVSLTQQMGILLMVNERISLASQCSHQKSRRTIYLCCSLETTTDLHMQPFWWCTPSIFPWRLGNKCHCRWIKWSLTKLENEELCQLDNLFIWLFLNIYILFIVMWRERSPVKPVFIISLKCLVTTSVLSFFMNFISCTFIYLFTVLGKIRQYVSLLVNSTQLIVKAKNHFDISFDYSVRNNSLLFFSLFVGNISPIGIKSIELA